MKLKINNKIRFSQCSFCNGCDSKTHKEARMGKMITICEKHFNKKNK